MHCNTFRRMVAHIVVKQGGIAVIEREAQILWQQARALVEIHLQAQLAVLPMHQMRQWLISAIEQGGELPLAVWH